MYYNQFNVDLNLTIIVLKVIEFVEIFEYSYNIILHFFINIMHRHKRI